MSDNTAQALAKLLRVARLVLAELNDYHGPIMPPDDIRRPLKVAIRQAEQALSSENIGTENREPRT